MHNHVMPPPPHLIFSIIIPVFNTEKYIERCLKSCIEQTYSNIEIIVVDDCGQDQVTQIVERYAKEDARIRIVRNQRNLGVFYTRINGTKNAEGDFLIYVDSDDFIEKDACEKIAKVIEDEYKKQTLILIFVGLPQSVCFQERLGYIIQILLNQKKMKFLKTI